jgi:atlastin
MAVLLMDTQGMFDNEASMALTAQIFGVSTLISSFQIYNIHSKIQEDNLQHLALFSEYGRIALLPNTQQQAIREKETVDEVFL